MLRAALIIIQIALIFIMVRPHFAREQKCVEYRYNEVKLYESKYVDLVWPWAQRCVKRYDPATNTVKSTGEES